MTDTGENTIKQIEALRRSKDYKRMQELATQTLASDFNPAHRARIYYEMHMAAWQRYRDTLPLYNRELLDESLQLAYLSGDEAERADDKVGMLHVQMNISGLILPALGLYGAALSLSRNTAEAAERRAVGLTLDERFRALRVAMNCYFHQVRILIATDGDKEAARELWTGIQANDEFQREQAAKKTWFEKDLDALARFLDG